jgi:diguanylate cyclase (GGDEF)-like protein
MLAGGHSSKGYRRKQNHELSAETIMPSALELAVAGKVLIVDDVEDNRIVLGRRLSKRGFEVVYADSGEEALRRVRKQQFDAVLLDVMMPGMDGNETLCRIRQEFCAATLPVIMVTAKTQTSDIVESLALGANDYLTKPVDFSIALARINNQVSIRRARLDLQRSEEKVAYLAQYDLLTGLPNRYAFDEKLQASLERAAELGLDLNLLFVDLDHFKNINDTLGHAVGDELLKLVAERLSCVLSPEEFCARLGGDEFSIIQLSEDGLVTGRELSQKLIAALAVAHNIAGGQIFIGASIGVATTRQAEQDAPTLLKHADLALHQAKSDGRGGFRFF